jgi:putative CocE/NonD family hydrolase
MRLKKTTLVAVALFSLAVVPRGASVHARPQTKTAAASRAESRFEVVTREGMRAKMRDGVELVADVYSPRAEGRFPVLVERTPYDRRGEAGMARELAAHGYVVVLQDTRGRYDSGGEFYPFMYESQDGYDTVEWAAALEHSDGQVGMFGGSYVGATQMLAAMARPPHLAAIFPYVTASEYYDGWTYQGGALMQWFASSWTSILAQDTLRRKSDETMRPKEWVNELPVESYPVLKPPAASELAPYFRDWLRHERDDEYWRRWKVSDHYGEMNVKGLHAGGWHDLFLKGSIKNYTGLRERGATAAAREGQRLVVGPWAHAPTSPEGKVGDVTFGKAAVLDMTGTALKWFDYALKGARNEYATAPPVSIFVMGENVWRAEREFPLARTRYTKYFLRSSRGAVSVAGDGSLSTAPPPGEERPEEFVYDPANPVPTIGGRLCCGQALPPGPFDQRPNEGRRDVLVFSTPPLETDTEVTGFVTVELYASTSAPDTDFTAMLVDVAADGYARFLTDGVVRARYREMSGRAEALSPGRVYKYSIDLWATSNLFKAGHRIRLYVSSSNFPRFDRNLNTGEPASSSTRMLKAEQAVYHDAARASALVLPIIPR